MSVAVRPAHTVAGIDPPPTSRAHLLYLDGLRGIAILMVVAIHSSQQIAGLAQPVRDLAFYGIRGVQLFFVVSGLTLMMNYAGRTFQPANFVARRFFRIAPMFYVGIVLYLLLGSATAMSFPARDATPFDIAATVTFLHGWSPRAINMVVPGGWSIAAEMMFYACFPALLLLADRPKMMAGGLVASYFLAGASYLVLRRLFPGAAGADIVHYFWLLHFPAFVGGCLLAVLVRTDRVPRRGAAVFLWLAVVGMVIDSQLRDASNLLVPIFLLTVFAWAATVVRPRLLEHPLLVTIGRISFSLYILHFAVLALLKPLAPVVEAAIGATPALLVIYGLTLAIGGAMAWCSYRWIELPAVNATRHLGLRPSES